MSETSPRERVRGVPAKSLTLHGYSICFFPEQPKRESVIEQDRATEDIIEKKSVKAVETSAPPSEYWRLHWRNRLVYLIAFVSFSLSLNNVYYFPLNVYRYSGRFFLPYTIFTVIIGYPLHVLQVSMGQYSQRGIVWVWECAPIAAGIGFAMLVACITMSTYYNIFAAYALVYFSHCFNRNLPWNNCTKTSSDGEACREYYFAYKDGALPAKHYFFNHILNAPQKYPPEVWAAGSLKWWLVFALFFSWFVVYVSTLRSCRSIGKIAIFLVIFSYFAIIMLLIAFLQLKDSDRGPNLTDGHESSSFLSFEMWCVAAIQVVLELGLCFGIPLVYGSYCHFRNYLYIDSIILCLVNYLNSLIFFILFYCLFRMFICDNDDPSKNLFDSSFGIIYIMFSSAFTFMKGSSWWCLVFFLMIFCIVIGTQIAFAEAIMTVMYDHVIKLSEYRWLINLIICFVFFLIGITFCLSNGFYDANFLETMPIWFIVIPFAFFFAFGVVLIYGLSHYNENMEIMLNQKVGSAQQLVCYLLIGLLFVSTLAGFFIMRPSSVGDVAYQKRYVGIGWFLFALFLVIVFLCAALWAIFCCCVKTSPKSSLKSWDNYCEESKEGKGRFTTTYYSSYIWPWK